MRLYSALMRQHIGWHFQKHWKVQGKRNIVETSAVKSLEKHNKQIYTPQDILRQKHEFEPTKVVSYGIEASRDKGAHPDWHSEVMLTVEDHHLLIEGLKQAKLLTKTIEPLSNTIVQKPLNKLPKSFHTQCKSFIKQSTVFDSEQVPLPIYKCVDRPAWNFPRSLGISQNKRINLLISKLLMLVEGQSAKNVVRNKYLFAKLAFVFDWTRGSDLIRLDLSADYLIGNSEKLNRVAMEDAVDFDKDVSMIEDMFPLKETVSLEERNIYKKEAAGYPIQLAVRKHHPHTLIIGFNDETVRNAFGSAVSDSQIFGRSLLKTFAAAATYARQKYGNDVGQLPEPVVVQCVHTNGQWFHFGTLQLNTLNLDNSEETNEIALNRNLWFQSDKLHLFDKCQFVDGKPILEGYNDKVVEQLFHFYNNV